ncbi:tagaturonate reductase [Saccharococcus caldoxylosilyticus]|uniref:tagaturonate reductase n=1 Tax=Saccharococcus caldoxylosilyticus TaxID=81408 RepID=UPI001FCB8497|nr:tagaturonate reductase [Parageobacillus caldoxylosilyticus]BDG36130.1 altronate oxidoreductase [Parageobacillus caldoxylosilyticus]BDG39915.1 altronate oxidoreductase [Parageobacillus caldoxylosilyticus]
MLIIAQQIDADGGAIFMQRLNRQHIGNSRRYPEKIIQFGSGNFLRAFLDWQIELMNKKAGFDAGVTVIQSTNRGAVDKLNEQEGLFTVYIRGIANGRVVQQHEVVTCVNRGIHVSKQYPLFIEIAQNPDLRFVFSNTTEAGICFKQEPLIEDVPPQTFPGKLTVLLYKRFQYFRGALDKGLIIIPCELIEKNGEVLRKTILQYAEHWGLNSDFIDWVYKANTFCNSLVDRIVSGYPKNEIEHFVEQLGYEDQLLTVAEPYYLWVIEGPDWLENELPFRQAGLNILLVDDLTPYRERKVRILNGLHTALTPIGHLFGCRTVRDVMQNETIRVYMDRLVNDEIIPMLDLPRDEIRTFVREVFERFNNPFIDHYLSSIALNSMAKFRTRNLPTLLSYIKQIGRLPKHLVFSLSALIVFYKEGSHVDDSEISQLCRLLWEDGDGSDRHLYNIVRTILGYKDLWGQDLNDIPELTDLVFTYLAIIERKGIKEAIQQI